MKNHDSSKGGVSENRDARLVFTEPAKEID
jgi:hypothetical protein